jgi:MFS transporter, AAHS family, vanillate permease
MTDHPQRRIDRLPMTRFQVIAVTLCVLLNMLDGYDLLAMAYTAGDVAFEMHLDATKVGVLLAAGLIGTVAGALLLAPWADRFGRRPLLIVGLVLMTFGMLATSLAGNGWQLASLRALTGFGIGAMLATVTVVTSEYSSKKWRTATISLQMVAYTVGASIGGTVAESLIPHFGWRSVFAVGGLMAATMIPFVLWRMPETLAFLLARRPPDALARVNRLLTRMHYPTLEALPAPRGKHAHLKLDPSDLFGMGLARSTVLTSLAFLMVMSTFYFVLGWTPRLLIAAGLLAHEGDSGGMVLNVSGILGALAFAAFSVNLPLKPFSMIFMLICALAVAAIGIVSEHLAATFVIAVAMSATLFGSMAALHAITPRLYPAAIRTTGMGFAIGVGRIGAIVAAAVAAALTGHGWQPFGLYFVFALPLFAALFMTSLLRFK